MPLKVKNRKQFKVAVYCLLTAATFWFFNAMGNRYTTDVGFPVDYEVSQDLILEKATSSILVSVQGTGWNIISNQIGYKIAPVSVNLIEPGRYAIKTSGYTSFIRGELEGIEVKQVITDTLSCLVTKRND